MFKMSHTCKNHSYPVFVGSINGFLIPDRTSGLDYSRDTSLMGCFHAIGKGEKRIGCHNATGDTLCSLTNRIF